jgi:pimeloyl-ACP methyl ester carboxylesterase
MSTATAATLFPTLSATSLNAAVEYWTDAWQRSVLFWDALRERGNEYIEHEQSGKPPVLVFDYQIVLDARRFERPANYALAAIEPPPDCAPTDVAKRPFVVIDPRAGHGPGIGGFKMDSEIGIALKAGHPCYFVMFFPLPVDGQTVECVTLAERIFIEKVNERHPNASKPFVIGNCQGGWALMILAALAPQSVGPILLAGSPVSYWAGVAGKHPMRYMGGLMGGTWTASLAGDLGNGKFDGANLVNNFEKLDPANTYWSKLYGLYAGVDTERERYLEFERWWGGHFLLNKAEMEWITQNLFVGNRLSAGEIRIDGAAVNLRNIRSPIVVFASWGDNITPPQQALNWIPDLYDNVEEIRDNEQTIVYFLHEQIGHLGIFVSSGVANREHSEFASALDLIDVLPPGLYEAIIRDTTPDMPGLQGGDDRHVIRFEPRDVADILALGDGREGERAFELVRHVSQMNQAMYDKFLSPMMQMFSSEISATALRNLNPARSDRLLFSDSNPVLKALKPLADIVRAQRKPVAPDNPLLELEKQTDAAIRNAWDSYRDARDAMYERTFKAIYESPWLAAMTGFKPDMAQRSRANNHSEEQEAILRERRAEHETWFDRGSPETGFLRLMIYVASGNGVVDERPFNGIRRLMRERGLDKTVSLQQLKDTIKQQTFLVRMDEQRALSSLASLLTTESARQRALDLARELLSLTGPISVEKEGRLQNVAQALGLKTRAHVRTPAEKSDKRGAGAFSEAKTETETAAKPVASLVAGGQEGKPVPKSRKNR